MTIIPAAKRKWSVEQPRGTHPERNSQLLDNGYRGIPTASLDIADIGAVDISPVSIVLLAPALLLPKATDVLGKARADVHAQHKRQL